ncbi:MAG: hypothetical protein BWY76_02700 [bacterium ADurb.Bin429]|nr:MAG: hypothetical protein BWY76_02700 [bacterium ADurb.Bin429]
MHRQKGRVDNRGNVVGNHDFFKEAVRNEAQAFPSSFGRRGVPVLELRQHVSAANDRPGDQMRKHREIGEEMEEMASGLHGATIHVNDIAHRMERVETDADRQHQMHNGNWLC